MNPVVIIGGGASGAITALNLRKLLPKAPPIIVIEPREKLGLGLAYGTQCLEHRINVPASKMSAVSSDPTDFARWLAEHDDGALAEAEDRYPSRVLFGHYLADRLAPYLREGTVVHVRDRVEHVQGSGPFTLRAARGDQIVAARVVIATSHPAPALPAFLAPSPRVIENPWADKALEAIGADERVAIIGTGLSMADVIATLAARGHRAPVLAFSRRGLRSRGHASAPSSPLGVYGAERATRLLAQIRENIAQSGDWHAVIDAVRQQGYTIWSQLAPAERRRVVRHLRPFWDVHRFRIAPQIEATLNARIAENRLEVLAARLEGVAPDGTLTLRERGGKRRHWVADRVINTTGPDHRGLLQKTSFLQDLAQAGLIAPDPAGLGVHTDRDYRAVGQKSLFIIGPLARGTFGELMGFPEITAHAELGAASIVRTLTGEEFIQ